MSEPGDATELVEWAKAELGLALEIPPDFARDLAHGRPVEIGAWIERYRRFWAAHLDDPEAHLHRRTRESR